MKADQVEYEFLGLWVPEDMKARVPELSPVQPFRQPRDLIGCNLTRLDCVTMKELVQTASHPLIQGRIGIDGVRGDSRPIHHCSRPMDLAEVRQSHGFAMAKARWQLLINSFSPGLFVAIIERLASRACWHISEGQVIPCLPISTDLTVNLFYTTLKKALGCNIGSPRYVGSYTDVDDRRCGLWCRLNSLHGVSTNRHHQSNANARLPHAASFPHS